MSEKDEVELKVLQSPTRIPIESFKDDRVKSFKEKLFSFLQRRIFILSWIADYDREKATGDLISGITIGLTMVPQSLAYANLANVPPVYGLYSAFVGSLVYVIFGSVKEVSIGPTSLMSIVTITYTFEKPMEYVFVFTFIAGAVEFLMGVFRLGFIVDFISVPVVSSFSTSTALVIIVAQLKNLLGIKFSAKNFPMTIVRLCEHIAETRLGDCAVGVFAIAFLIFLKNIRDFRVFEDKPKVKRCLFYLSIARNAMIVLITAYLAYLLSETYSEVPFKLTEKVDSGIPAFTIPPFQFTSGNRTYEFLDIVKDLGSGVVLLPLVSIIANIAIAKSFTSGKIVDATQEMVALGLANLLGSFFKSIPTCGAFTRSAISTASGVRTPMSGVYSALMTLLALTLLTPYFNYIPKTTLAAILICAVLSLIDLSIAKRLWRTNKIDFAAWLGCLVVCLSMGVEVGLIFGIVISVLNLFLPAARPKIVIYVEKIDDDNHRIFVQPSAVIAYPGIDYIRERVNRAVIDTKAQFTVTLDFCKISRLDYTSIRGIESLVKDLKKQNVAMEIINLSEKYRNRLDIFS